jgi:hypothetical protein
MEGKIAKGGCNRESGIGVDEFIVGTNAIPQIEYVCGRIDRASEHKE